MIRFLVVIILACLLVLSAVAFCISDPTEVQEGVEIPTQVDNVEIEQEQGEQVQPVIKEDYVIEEGSQGADSPSGEGDDEEPSGDSLPELPLSLEAEQRISERIMRISEESGKLERPDYIFSVFAGYTNHGIDEVLPEHFFRGSIISLGLSFSHRSGFGFGVEQFAAPDGGGWFGSLEDRMVLNASLQKEFGSLYGSVRHRWVHIHHKARTDFFYGDRHRTSVRGGVSLGPLKLYALASSDLPAYVPVKELTVYGGGGVDLRGRVAPLDAEFYLDASAVGSLFLYNRQDGRALYRVRAGFTAGNHNIIFNPEIRFLKGVFNTDNLLVTSFKVIF